MSYQGETAKSSKCILQPQVKFRFTVYDTFTPLMIEAFVYDIFTPFMIGNGWGKFTVYDTFTPLMIEDGWGKVTVYDTFSPLMIGDGWGKSHSL